jgi:hypothetical protein
MLIYVNDAPRPIDRMFEGRRQCILHRKESSATTEAAGMLLAEQCQRNP